MCDKNRYQNQIYTFNLHKIIILLLIYILKNIGVVQTRCLIGNSYHTLDNKLKQSNNKHHGDKFEIAVAEENPKHDLEYNSSYDYNNFLREYYSDDSIQFKMNVTKSQQKGDFNLNYDNISSCDGDMDNIKYIYLKPIKSYVNDIKAHKRSTEVAISRLKVFLKIFLFMYLILAMPLWCTKGWYCCCLSCKFFKPNQIIGDAQIFLESNPPGVLLHRGGVIYYEPTDNERVCYERLQHLIRTI